jgi:hypothetical protein
MWRDSIHGQKPATYSRQRSLPCRARYDAYGVGLVVFVLLQAVERRIGIRLRDDRKRGGDRRKHVPQAVPFADVVLRVLSRPVNRAQRTRRDEGRCRDENGRRKSTGSSRCSGPDRDEQDLSLVDATRSQTLGSSE